MDGIGKGLDVGQQFALDVQGLDKLKHSAGSDGQNLQEACRQFEALFLHMMLSSMRAAVPESGLLESQQGNFYESLLDQQWSQHLAGKGLGLADQLTKQLDAELANTQL